MARRDSDPDALMEFTTRIAGEAGRVTREHFGRAAVERKDDGSEVTAADRAAEAYLRAAIAERFPDDGILGEEEAEKPSRNGRRWVLDPVDGTRSFACGIPLYAVLVALEEEGTPTLGCCHLPVLGGTLVAARGAGAWLDGERARVSECDALEEARLVTSGWEYWRDYGDEELRSGLRRLADATRFTRTWGDGYGYFLVATGRVDLLADPVAGSWWDCAPMTVLLPEAGGRFTQFDGSPPQPWKTALASNGRLHDAAAGVLRGGPPSVERRLRPRAAGPTEGSGRRAPGEEGGR